jgi:hypothetical protein
MFQKQIAVSVIRKIFTAHQICNKGSGSGTLTFWGEIAMDTTINQGARKGA